MIGKSGINPSRMGAFVDVFDINASYGVDNLEGMLDNRVYALHDLVDV